MPSSNMPLQHIDDFELKTLEKQQLPKKKKKVLCPSPLFT